MGSTRRQVEDGAAATPPAQPALTAAPPPTDEAADALTTRAYRPGDEHWLVETFSLVFRRRSLEEWRWLFEARADGPDEVDIAILEHDGQPIGSTAHIGASAWVDGRRMHLAIGCDMMVHPRFRGRGGAGLLVEALRTSGHSFDLNFGTVTGGSRQVTRRRLGSKAMGWAPIWLRFRARRIPGRPLLGRALAVLDRGFGRALSWPRPSPAVVDLETLGSEVDELARDSAAFARCIRVRDAHYLRWHWQQDPRTAWRIRGVVGTHGELRGLAVIGTRGEGDERSGVVADLLARDYGAVRALLCDAWEQLAEEGVTKVACVYRDPRWWGRVAMLRSGFRRSIWPGPQIACGPLSEQAGDVVRHRRSWYLTGADTDL